jgi:hypothetical protein
MSNEIIESVTYDNYNDFRYVNLISSQLFILLFWGLFNDKTQPESSLSALEHFKSKGPSSGNNMWL